MADDERARVGAAPAFDLEADLEVELAEAKEEYRGNPDDDKAKKRLDKAKRAIVEARRERREAAGVAGVTVGGDAVQGDEN